MKMKQFQRLLAFVLVICMVIPMLPEFTLPAAATDTSTTEKPVIVIAGSDFQAADDATGAANVTSILTAIKKDYATANGFLFAGDYVQSTITNATTSTSGKNALVEAVNGVYSGLGSTNAVYVQGNHDPDSMTTDGTLSTSGAHDADAYGVYVINEKDYMWYNNDETTIKNTATALDTYLDAKVEAGYSKPIFVISHLPLHYNMRTVNDGDGQYANYIFDVLNNAGSLGLNIIFLFGHDHSNGWDDYLGGSAIYLAKGDSINIAQASRSNFEVETLKFTYMNAGYVGYYDGHNTGTETDLTMTVFEITSDKVTVARYSADGKHDLKSVGVTNSYKNETAYEPDTRVYASPQNVLLNKVLRDDATGVVVSGSGLTALKVAEGNVSQVPAGYTVYQTYDILVDGHNYGTSVNVSIPVDDTFDATKPVLVIDHEKNKTMVCDIVDGCVHFKTTHFSMYTVAQADVEAVSASGTLEKYLKRANSLSELKEGVPYVISDYKDSWYHYMLTNTSAVYKPTSTKLPGLLLEGEPSPNTTHLWYLKEGMLVYGSADSEEYLLITSSGVTLGSYNADTVAYPVTNPYPGSYGTDDLGIMSASGYLNRRGGGVDNNIATYYTSHSGSYWHFDEVVSDVAVSLTVTPSQNTVGIGSTVVLTPSILVDGVSASNYDITWETLDTSIASVENGVVTPVEAGQVYIRATLNSVDGVAVTSDVSVDILLTVAEVTKDDSGVTASTVMDLLGEETTLTEGTASGPYVIVNWSSGWVLTGNTLLTTDSAYYGSNGAGLQLIPEKDTRHVWYYDGTHLLYGSSTGSDNYLVYDAEGKITLGANDGTATLFDSVVWYESSNAPYYYYGIAASAFGSAITDRRYVGHYGGDKNNTTSLNPLKTSSGSSYYQSRWKFFNAFLDTNISLTVSPNEYILMPNMTVSLAPTVKVDGTKTSTYSLTWTSSDTSLATVDANGKVTAQSSTGGNVTITATLTAVDGVTLNAPLAVEIPIQLPAVTTDHTDGLITASIILGARMKRVTELQQGTPYVITNEDSGAVVTNKLATGYNNVVGLELIADNDFSHVWYYNGTNLLYGEPTGTNNYLTINNSANVALGTSEYAANSVTTNADGITFSVKNTNLSTSNKYLNQYGGGKAAHGYSMDGSSNDGSSWYFNQVMSNEKVELKIDYDPKQSIDQIQKIDTTVWLDGVLKTGDYEIVWSSTNTSVATVSHGIVTPKGIGNVTITAKLVSVAETGLSDSFTVEIPIEITTINSVQISGKTGVTYVGTSSAASINQYLMVTYADGSTGRVPVEIGMLTDANGNAVSTATAGVFENLKVTYAGITVCSDFTLEVLEKNVDDYPDYPDEGAVSVDKTGAGIDFQSSGVAQIELSATGIPSKKGADVIIMLDTSSSMTSKIGGSDQSRLQVLTASLNNLVNQLQDDGSGDATDIRVAIADFNGYYLTGNSNYYIDPNDTTVDNSIRTTSEGDDVYTGTQDLTAGAFVDVHDLGVDPFYTKGYTGTSMAKYTLTYSSGTNYDYAFDAIYQLGEAIQTKNEAESMDRDLFVIFMSDGAPFQYNYFSSQSNVTGSEYWNNWLLGTFDEETMYGANANKTYYNKDGLHWMAEAIKGDPSTDYRVIRKNDSRDTDRDNWIEVKGLGATMYSIGFCLADDHKIKMETMDTVIQNIASNSNYYYKADTASELEDAFSLITNEIFYAATDAYFVDTMGAYYDIQLGTHNYEVVVGTAKETRTIAPVIQFKSYSIYTRQDFMNGLCVETQIGTRKTDSNGNYIYTLMEEVTFNAAGTEAYSNVLGSGNILIDGVIRANTFYYNTTSAEVTITEGTKTITIPAESFHWKLGTISTTELCLSYYVYLTDSLEGDRPAGIYDTNEHAKLFYTNYLGNACSQEVPTPKLPWQQATVGYGFYLVDENGNPIVNQTTGNTGSFENAVKLTNPVTTYFLLNSDGSGFEAGHLVQAGTTLPDGYELYDGSAAYQVQMNSNGSGSYTIYKSDAAGKQTTYVVGVETTAVTGGDANGETVETVGYTTASTVVWFAVTATTEAVPDTVVIDFGLPVDIHPLVNDLMMSTGNAVLAGVGPYDSSLTYTAALDSDFVDTEWLTIGSYGKAQITAIGTDNKNNAVIRYVPGTMQMEKEVVFTYAVHYTGTVGSQGYYYSTVTVIPATTIYYEDNFQAVDGSDYITYSTYTQTGSNTANKLNEHTWETVEDADSNTPSDSQAEDRPGDYNISFGNIDANNLYGYDDAYTAMKTYSNGSAMKFTAGIEGKTVTYGTAQFTFKGRGFDVISLTSSDTGTIVVEVDDLNVENVDGVAEYYYVVDTYYGYKYGDDPSTAEDTKVWYVDPDATDALYQVPVIKAEYATYSQYQVTITATYADFFDHKMEDGKYTSYDFYLDAIRIYDPAKDGTGNTVVQGAYTDDGEGWPLYQELRNMIITKNTFDSLGANDSVEGIVFIDGNSALANDNASQKNPLSNKTYAISDYANFGPNNELYLAPNQAIAFDLANVSNVASIQIALKTVGDFATGVAGSVNDILDGSGAASVKIYGASDTSKTNVISTSRIVTATDMYYDITDLMGQTVIIQNTGVAGILSITNVKITYKQDPYGTSSTGLIGSTSNTGSMALAALNAVEEEEQPEQNPGENVPGSDVEENPVTGDLNVEIVSLMVLTFCMMTLAVLVFSETRKRNAK